MMPKDICSRAQEAIPNYRKSARLTRRIIECEIINGNYKVAAKLLRRLQKTLFYRNWANQTMALLGNEKAINRHPIYGKLRKYREKEAGLPLQRPGDGSDVGLALPE